MGSGRDLGQVIHVGEGSGREEWPSESRAGAHSEVRRAKGEPEFLRLLVWFGLYVVVGSLILILPPVKAWFVTPWTALNAKWALSLAGCFGTGFKGIGTVVVVDEMGMNVKPGCNGTHALVLCLSAILAFPAAWGRRLAGVVLATVGVFMFNIIRLANLFLVAKYYPQHLELFHIFIWQTLFAMFAFGIFLLWGRFIAA